MIVAQKSICLSNEDGNGYLRTSCGECMEDIKFGEDIISVIEYKNIKGELTAIHRYTYHESCVNKDLHKIIPIW